MNSMTNSNNKNGTSDDDYDKFCKMMLMTRMFKMNFSN